MVLRFMCDTMSVNFLLLHIDSTQLSCILKENISLIDRYRHQLPIY